MSAEKSGAMQTAQVKWTGAEQFLAVGPSGHAVPMDADRGANTAPGPMEMLLVALGGCTASDVVLILGKKRQKLESLEVTVSGERAAEPPRVWTRLEIVYRLRGTLDEKAVRDAIELSESKYCSVAAMLRKTTEIRYRYEILPGAATD
jgi:putative redox protein